MKQLLTWITLVGTLAVVVVLATYLVLVAVALIRADRNLSALIEGLKAVRDNTGPLEHDLAAINDATVTLHDRLKAIDGHLVGIIGLVRRGDGIRQRA